ncbi:hypothetical protein LCGC14_2171130 [marine sediment metagenome]|uniref:Uncharacterized protein n=1 Tax=marine sediment metagenome TaxID=412755 RepID=A0A0F9GL21_9ZZZZ
MKDAMLVAGLIVVVWALLSVPGILVSVLALR